MKYPKAGRSSIWEVIAAFFLLIVLSIQSIPSVGSDITHISSPSMNINGKTSETSRGLSDAVGLEYIAIGESRFRDEMEPLIEWKTQKGVKAGYFPMDGEGGILETYSGRDIQEKIRNFIIDIWTTGGESEGPLKWVLLVGDGEIIPPRRTFVNGSSEFGSENDDNYVLSDLYYAGLTGSWDEDSDNIFGEEDSLVQEMDAIAEVNVGRFPASTEKELRTMVKRQLSYERDPAPGSWTGSMLLAGSLMDAPNNQALFDPYKDNAFELITKIEEMLPDDISPYPLLDYPRLEWGGYNRMFDTLNETSFTKHFEAGFSTVLLACHGDIDGNCTHYQGNSGGSYPYWADYGVYFNYTTAETIKNGERTPFVYISNCDSLNFTEPDDSNMERLMTNQNGGAIGVIGASVTTYRGEYFDDTSWGNWWLAEEFFEILNYNTSRPGEALYKLKEDYVNHVNIKDLVPAEIRMFNIDNLAYNLLGDPEVPLWLRSPKKLNIEYPEEFYQDNTSIEIRVRNEETGAFVDRATVCLMDPDNGSIYKVYRSNNYGEVQIPLIMDDLGELLLTVTKEGYLPSEKIIDVVSLRNVRIAGEPTLDPSIPIYGRPFSVTVTVGNTGNSILEGVTLYIELLSHDMSQRIQIPEEGMGTAFRLLSGEMINKTITFDSPFHSLNGSSTNKLTAWVEVPPGPLENDISDNSISIQFRANEEPSLVGLPSGFRIPEDSSLSGINKTLDLSGLVIDDDFPEELTFWTSVISGNLTTEISKEDRLDIIPENDWNGDGQIRVFASDGSVTVSRMLGVIVEPVPDPPVFRSWPDTVEGLEDEPVTFLIELIDVDTNEGDLNLTAPGWENISFKRLENRTSFVFEVNLTPGEEDLGSSVLLIIARDESNLTAEVKISLDIDTTNDPPEAEFDPKIRVEKGKRIKIPMMITDRDNDLEIRVGVLGLIVAGYTYENGLLTITPVDGLETGTYQVDIWIDDTGTRGNRTYRAEIEVVDKENSPIILTFILLVLVIIIILVGYGVFVRSQENKQKKMLDRVGDEVLLSKIKRNKKRGKEPQRSYRKGSIEAPPVPNELEGVLARKGIEEIESEDWNVTEYDEVTAFKDLESELEEVLDELYPGSEDR